MSEEGMLLRTGKHAGGNASLRLALPWAAALILACLHMLLFTHGYRLTADDASFTEIFMRGNAAIWESGSAAAHQQGRIGMFLLIPLNDVAAYLSGDYVARLGFVALYYANFLLFSLLISKVLRANVALLLFVVLVVMHPLAFEHMPPNSYPLQNTLPFFLILTSRILIMRLRESGTGRRHLSWIAGCLLLFAISMLTSEYAIVFGTALLFAQYAMLMVRDGNAGAGDAIARIIQDKSFRADGLAVAVVVGAYGLFRWFNPSQYDGNSPDGIFHFVRMGITTAGHIASGTIFGQIDTTPSSVEMDSLPATLAVGALAAICAWFLLPQAAEIKKGGRLLAISVCSAIFVTLPVAMTSKQQSWCLESPDCGFVDSRVSYFWIGAAVLGVLALAFNRIGTDRSARYFIAACSLFFGVVSMATYANNWRRAGHMDSISSAWERADILACLPGEVPQSDEALENLIDPRGEVSFHANVWKQSYWRFYVETKSDDERCNSSQRQLQRAYSELVAGVLQLDSGHKLKFSSSEARAYLAGGWSFENWGVWSVGQRASIKVGFDEVDRDMILAFHALRNDVGKAMDPVTIEVNGQPVAHIPMTGKVEGYAVRIPLSVLKPAYGEGNTVAFVVSDPISPKRAGTGEDIRALGVGLIDMTFEPAN